MNRLMGSDEELKCVVCGDLSVADSPSGMARAMREEITRRLRGGQAAEEIRTYFVERYGESILLTPPGTGLSLIPWVAPGVALLVGIGLVVLTLRRRGDDRPLEAPLSPADRARIARELASAEDPD